MKLKQYCIKLRELRYFLNDCIENKINLFVKYLKQFCAKLRQF